MTTTATPILPDTLASGDRLRSAGGATTVRLTRTTKRDAFGAALYRCTYERSGVTDRRPVSRDELQRMGATLIGGPSFVAMMADDPAAIEAEADRNAAVDWAVNQDRYSVLTTGERFAGRWAR